MSTMSLERLGGLALIVGPVLAFVMFLLVPGGLLIDTALPSDPHAAVNALTDNRAMATVALPLVSLGLMIMAFGIYALQASVRGEGDAMTRTGLAFILIGTVVWILAQTFALAVTVELEGMSGDLLSPLIGARVATTLIGGMAISLGFLIFALGLSEARALDTWVNRLVALLSLVSLASFYWAAASGDALDTGIAIARSLYVLWVAWLVYRGFRLMRMDTPSGG